MTALRSVKGIKLAFWGPEIATKAARVQRPRASRGGAEPQAGRSGDIIIAPEENWLMSTAVTTHGTQYTYDQRVPVIFFGASIRAGRDEAASPADLVPTLAAVAESKIAKTDGRVLTQALQ